MDITPGTDEDNPLSPFAITFGFRKTNGLNSSSLL